jgi:hypothetical protein
MKFLLLDKLHEIIVDVSHTVEHGLERGFKFLQCPLRWVLLERFPFVYSDSSRTSEGEIR